MQRGARRLALGSAAPQVFSLVLREGLGIVGVAAGLFGSWALRSTPQSQLYGVEPLEPSVCLAVAGVLVLVAVFACILPAHRATRINPVVALTQQE